VTTNVANVSVVSLVQNQLNPRILLIERLAQHPTFHPQLFHLTKSPYQVSRIGWGFFTIYAAIVLKPGYGWVKDDVSGSDPDGTSVLSEWTLDFEGTGSSKTLDLLIESVDG
jgi:hypothetical protein